MLIIALMLIVTALSSEITQANIHRLRTTPQINFTYYYYHQYPLPDAFEVALNFQKVGGNMSETFLHLKQVDQKVRAAAKKWNGTVVSNSQDRLSNLIEINFQKDTRVTATFDVRITDQQSLVGFLDEISKQDDIIILWVSMVRLNDINLEVEDLKAKDAAIQKSKEVCHKYFGMKFQKIVLFDKVVGNQSINQTEEIVGEYMEVLEIIDKIQQDNKNEFQAYFKCQIICQNLNFLSGKRDSSKLKDIDVEVAQKIAKAKIKSKPSPKPLKKQKSTNGEKVVKRRQNDDL